MNQEQILSVLKTAAEQSGLTQKEIAERSGIRQENVSRYLSGKKVPELATLVKLAEAVGLEVELRPVKRGRGRPPKK